MVVIVDFNWLNPNLIELVIPIFSETDGSFTNTIIGIEKTAHHIATVKNDNLIALAASEMPKSSGLRYIKTLIKNKIPPPI